MPALSLSNDPGRQAMSDEPEPNVEDLISDSVVCPEFKLGDHVQWDVRVAGSSGPGTGPKATFSGKVVQIVVGGAVPFKTKEILESGKDHSAVDWSTHEEGVS